MKCVDSIDLPGAPIRRSIELYTGDLAAIPAEQRVDVLGVSAFRSDYRPVPRSVIGALDRAGVSVTELSRDKAEDLRDDFGCWLSRRVDAVGFDRVLCFEPATRGLPYEVVGDFFRCLAALAGASIPLRSVAIPIFAAGSQRYPVPVMMRAILHAATEWMSADFPLRRLKIVIRDAEAERAAEVFREVRTRLTTGTASDDDAVDVVLTAAPEDGEYADVAADVIAAVAPELRVYRSPPSTVLIGNERTHFSRMDHCRRAIALITPRFLHSKACQDDLYVARFRAQQSLAPLLFPILLQDTELPPSLRVLRMVDCRALNLRNLRMVSAALAIQVQEARAGGEPVDGPSDEGASSAAIAISTLAHALGSPVVGASRRYTDVGAPGSVSRQSLVLELCRSLFSPAEFRVVLRHLPWGEELLQTLPAGDATPLVFFDAAVESMARRGMIDDGFFAALCEHRPLRAPDVRSVAMEWDSLGPRRAA